MTRISLSSAVIAFAAGALLTTAAMAQTPSSPSFGHNTTDCKGINACKGQSACKSTTNACKGQNSCKGKGWVQGVSSLDCLSQGGIVGGGPGA